MCNYIITNEEIEKAEKDVFKNGEHFNNEQKTFLKCLDSCCVQAYAGTGKTSAVVGKLHVLAQKNAWKNGRGICVISHTNVAVDEIKKHVAIHYPAIMQYPNFVGTIQEFVNKFLFIPYLAKQGLRIRYQDEYRYLNFNNFPIVKQRINNYRKSINRPNNIKREQQLRSFNEAVSSCFLTDCGVSVIDSGKTTLFLNKFKKLPTKNCDETAIIDAFKRCISESRLVGYFLFCESFVDGYEYIKQNPIFKRIISQRFQFVFLDEAQDCSEIQLSVLKELFDEDPKTIFQQIGDINQAISETKWAHGENYLPLNQSVRFGNNLAKFINKFQIGNNKSGVLGTTRDTRQYLITYNSGEETSVLKKFAEILKKENISTDEDFFAISCQHKQLAKYFPDYSEKLAKNKNKKTSYRFDRDIDYVNLLTKKIILQQGSNFVSRILLSLLYNHFEITGNSWSEFKDYLRANGKVEDFKKLVLDMSINILRNNSISDLGGLKNKLNIILGENKIDFTGSGGPRNFVSVQNPKENKFSYGGIDINIGIIHSVKGQTHNATLCFSNEEYGKQDIQHTLDGTPSHTPRYKRLLYVASSRSKHLFAFAIEQSAYKALTDKTMFQDFFIVETL